MEKNDEKSSQNGNKNQNLNKSYKYNKYKKYYNKQKYYYDKNYDYNNYYNNLNYQELDYENYYRNYFNYYYQNYNNYNNYYKKNNSLFNTFPEFKYEAGDFPSLKNEKDEEKKEKEFEYLLLDINSLDDLIQLGLDYGTKYSVDKEYNINLKTISELVDPLKNLNKLIGLKPIKKQIVELILFYTLNLDDKNQDLLHTVIEGEPGTGKTELAQALSKVYLKMGILTKDVFTKVRVSDLKGEYLGHSAAKTQKILEDTVGGVLFIDEAYSLGNSEGKHSKDVYSKEIIDLINQWLTEHKNDFICIIAGYKEDLKNSFFSFNDGLERRFPIRFSIEGYDSAELKDIFFKKVLENGWSIFEDALTEKDIENNKEYFKFNGGDMEVLFTKCKIAHAKNLLKIKDKPKKILDIEDIEEGIKLFKQNPNVNERKESDNKTTNYMYI